MPLSIISSPPGTVGAFFEANAVGFKRPDAVRFKHGVLSPGAYIDNRKLPSHVLAWEKVLGPLIEQARSLRHSYNVVASVDSGGVPHGVAIARHLHLAHVTVKKQEKGHGLAGLISGDTDVLRGSRVLLVEDMSSTFESSLKAMKPLEHAGARISHTLVLNTWNLPDFQSNIGAHSVYALCTGETFLKWAAGHQLIDEEHADIVRYWLQHPEDERWAHDGKWVLPKE